MKLIVNGDDFGITKACNYAIIDCFKNGILRSTSMMMNMPDVEHAALLMKQYPKLSVGIHFNLTVGKPLTNCPSLCKEDGTFNKGNLKNSDHVKMEEIRQELQAQYDRFVEVTGQKPHHLNSHHGICLIQGGEQAQLELAEKYQLPIRQMITSLIRKEETKSPYGVTKMTPMTMSNEFLTPQKMMASFTKEMLESDDVYEFAAHPGYVDYDLTKVSSLLEGRYHDAYTFMSDEIKNWVKENNIELVDYREILKK